MYLIINKLMFFYWIHQHGSWLYIWITSLVWPPSTEGHLRCLLLTLCVYPTPALHHYNTAAFKINLLPVCKLTSGQLANSKQMTPVTTAPVVRQIAGHTKEKNSNPVKKTTL